MSERSTEQIRALLDSLYRADSGRILATLERLGRSLFLLENGLANYFHAKDFTNFASLLRTFFDFLLRSKQFCG
jgi:hypothetical protein